MKNLIARFVREDAGQDLIEYALLGSFVSLAAYVGANFLGDQPQHLVHGHRQRRRAAASNIPTIT